MGNDDGLALSGFRLRVFQAVGVAAAVAEFERVGGNGGKVDPGEGPVIEEDFQPDPGADTQMVATGMADMQVLGEFAMEEHLLAGRAFVPEIVGDITFPYKGSDLGSDEFGEPAHIVLMGLSIRPPDGTHHAPRRIIPA